MLGNMESKRFYVSLTHSNRVILLYGCTIQRSEDKYEDMVLAAEIFSTCQGASYSGRKCNMRCQVTQTMIDDARMQSAADSF